MQTKVLEVTGLEKRFKKFHLGPMDFELEQGMIVGLVGANGSGKSTFLRLLMKLMREDGGVVKILGMNWKEEEEEVIYKKKIGYAGELLESFDSTTIKDIKFFISHFFPTWNEEKFTRLVERYRIDIDEKFSKCSKGTKKKIDFIFAMAHEPQLLLLDEPTSGVDIVSQKKMKEDLIRFMEEGERSIVLATHTVDEINQLCDQIMVMDQGRITQSFYKDEIHDHWGRVWVSHITNNVKNHPNVIRFEVNPAQIVTNHVSNVEDVLQAEQITINQTQRLSMEEVLEYLIEQE
ncbi:ABC transporter ATP-binding protein [Oceanobacillus caeni]|uniref:ABC transporter ATP-binding protein n=1 Tax=Bacillaceae TaxID=186817 RepID=UPI00069AC286|nr:MULTISPECIES: ABC transporter ATP-binding protein [Bacillaceae]PZD83021.1 ABC transporter ATP-binding protein [Bacilli bacterium]MBU8791882.1 ABC transporter ATP-binding protein [Oceanobacillus caeni]MCR1835397.1 ABC transporter ATP-binding protein [Oceanobacillus caeni]MED4475239.1 ABC transporter ATP-binding protein [Oceanobacillus caeni]PZD83834.1 ABC transporter ATP-binding protein [Bacilli bacterium]